MELPLLVNDFLRRAAELYPDKTAIIDGQHQFSYRDFQTRANQLSNALLTAGVTKGDRVCVLSPNSHHFLESFYGVSQIGAILVPLNYRLTAADHEYIINHAGIKVLLVDAEYASVIDGIRPRLRTVENWVTAGSNGAAPAGWTRWERFLAGSSTDHPQTPDLDESDLVSINYTSGTTARPKGVMLTHRNCYINAYSFIAHFRITHDDVELWTLPMFHCNGWGGVYAITAMGGTHVVLRSVSAEAAYDLIARHKVTFACMAPTILRTLLDYTDRSKHRITTRPRFVVAGAPPPAAYIERLESELGWEFIQAYGLTETSPLLTLCTPDHRTAANDYARRMRAGVPMIGVSLKVCHPDGSEVPRDDRTVGEVWTRSNVVFKGYWDQPEATDEAHAEGYFRTGDLAVWDESGSIHIVDRKKDVIISGGENISSPEIEDALYQHPAVKECAVIGVPHEKWGETPKALIVARDGTKPAAEEIIAFCRERLAHFKCPTSVEFLDALPRTATGKLQKYKLREKYWSSAERRVH